MPNFNVPDLVVDQLVLTQEVTIEYEDDIPLNITVTPTLIEASPGVYEVSTDVAFNTAAHLTQQEGSHTFDYSVLNGNQVDTEQFTFEDNQRTSVTLIRPSAIPVTIVVDL